MAAISESELFDAEFLEAVGRLRLVANRVQRGGRFAEQRSHDLGHGIEFRDYRPYTPGDDLRAVDWNIYRRLGRVFLRLFEEVEDLPLYLMPDVSRSAFHESPPRAHAGLRTALALAAISLGQHDSVGIFPFSDDLSIAVRPQAGKSRVLTFARHLAAIQPGTSTDLPRSLKRFGGMRLREGLLTIISDFFDPAGIDAVLDSLKGVRHKLLLVQLVRATDREPDVSGDLRLVDCETGSTEDVSVTAHVLERYKSAYDDFQGKIARFARRRNAGLLQLDVDREVVPQLATLFETGAYRV